MKSVKLGMIKGGQLGRMFLQTAVKYPVSCYVLDSEKDAPCRDFCSNFVQGDSLDAKTVYEFGKNLDVVTLEFEHVSTEGLEKLEHAGVKVYPRAEIIRLIQDKGRQKDLYRSLGIPTADYILLNSRKDLDASNVSLPVIQKLRLSGYDGKGVIRLKDKSDFQNAFEAPSIIEEEIDFVKEIAVIGARSVSGEIKIYQAVEIVMDPVRHVLDYLVSPANISEDLSRQAADIVKKLLQELEYVGVLSVEMFVTADNRVLVNEMAPRAHNSGHHTIEACRTSQYEQQLRAVLGLPLGSTEQIFPAVMINLLGAEGESGPVKYEGLECALREPGVYVHLYGKKETRPYRKMGHVTVLRTQLDEAIKIAKVVSREIKIGAC